MTQAEMSAENSLSLKCIAKLVSIQGQQTSTRDSVQLEHDLVVRLQKPIAAPCFSRFVTFTEDGICWRGSTYFAGTKVVESSIFAQFFIRYGANLYQRVPAKFKSKPADHNTLSDLKLIYKEILTLESSLKTGG